MNIERIRQKKAFQPNAVATQKQATRDFMRSLHTQYPISLTLTLKQSYPITNANGTYTQTLTRDEARRIARHFTHKLNQQVFGSSAKRYGKSLKYLIVAEGERTYKNIHLHMAIGGLPSYVKWNELDRLVRDAKQRIREIDGQYKVDLVDSGWAEYITKEVGMTDTENVFWDLA